MSDVDESASLDLQGDSSTSSDDAELMGVWQKHNGPEAALDKPPMPESFAKAEGDDIDAHVRAAYNWNQMELGDRQVAFAVDHKNADLRKQASALGMKLETAADYKAVQEMINGGRDQQSPAIDRDVQATFNTVRSVFPDARDAREASERLHGLVEHVTRNPVEGALAVLQSLPLTPYQRSQVYERMFGDAMQHQQPQQPQPQQEPDDATLAAAVSEWSGQRGLSMDDRVAMAEILNAPTFRSIEGESEASMLDRAYRALQRSQARAGKDHSTRRTNASLDHDLRRMVRK